MNKTFCPAHEDATPSLHLYPDGAFCFVCGYSCPLEAIGNEVKAIRLPPQDLPSMLSYIESLTPKLIRGLWLPSDERGYYVVWPDNKYYKQRLFRGDARYKGPRGHRAPLFRYHRDSKNLVIVEGELNAMSLLQIMPDIDAEVVSPGSCNEMIRHLNKYLLFDRVWCIVDKDAPGVANGLALKDELRRFNKPCTLIALETDINDHLSSKEEEKITKHLELHGVPRLGRKSSDL